jgi:hypothetical protein
MIMNVKNGSVLQHVLCENEEAQNSYFSLNKSEAMRWAGTIAHDGETQTW